MLLEANARAACFPKDCPSPVIGMGNRVLLVIYTCEMFVRMFVERGKYFTSKWNILDFCIVIFGYLDE
eukprot:4907805-Heterocapsa_arctica.AAC.1